MKAHLYGHADNPVIAVIGVWDPILPKHKELFERLCSFARRTCSSSLVIAIDPDPVRYLYGIEDVPVYNDFKTRVQRIINCGVDAVLGVHFIRRDIEATAADFLAVIDPHVELKELWLGARQSLGRWEEGSFATVTKLAKLRGARVIRLPLQPLETYAVRRLLQAGHFAEAARLVGCAPIRRRPESGRLQMAWPPGHYQALEIDGPALESEGRLLELCLTPRAKALSRMDWPDKRIKRLAFVTGPSDSL